MTTARTPVNPTTTYDRRRWLALAVLMTATFLDLVDVTIVNIATPSIRADLVASFSEIQWVTTVYALFFALGLITAGRLGDIVGRKKVFLLGIAGFTVASLLSGLAGSPEMLIGARVMQGAAAALMVPQVLAIIHVTFPVHERGKVFGMFGAMLGLGSITGPLLGALLIQWNLFGLEWRPIFLINIPFGIAGIVLGRRYIAESRSSQALRLDLLGVALATLGLMMLIYPLTQGRESGWPLWGFMSMIGSLAVFALFLRHQRAKTLRDNSPLVELSLFRVRSFVGGIGVQLTYGLVSGIFFLVWTLYMQIGLGWSPLHAGLTGIPFSLAAAVTSGLSVQMLVPRFGRRVLQAGALVKLAGVLLYIWEANRYGAEIQSLQMALPLLLMGAGMGLIMAPLTESVLSDVPREHAGSASGLISTTNQLGLALGLGLVSVTFFLAVDAADPATQATGEIYSGAFSNAMWYVAAGLVVVFALVFALPRTARRRQPDVAPTLAGEAVEHEPDSSAHS